MSSQMKNYESYKKELKFMLMEL